MRPLKPGTLVIIEGLKDHLSTRWSLLNGFICTIKDRADYPKGEEDNEDTLYALTGLTAECQRLNLGDRIVNGPRKYLRVI